MTNHGTDERSDRPGPHGLAKVARCFLFILVLCAVIFYIFVNIEEIRHYSFEINWLYLGSGFGLMVLVYLVLFGLWLKLSANFGLETPWARAARAWYLSHLGKYVPGKITMLLVRLEAYPGSARSIVTVASLVEYFCMLAATCFFVLVMLLPPHDLVPGSIRWLALIGVFFFLGMLWPPFLGWVLNFGLRVARQKPIEHFPSYFLLLGYTIAYIVPVLGQSLAFFLVLRSFGPVGPEQFCFIAGVYFSATLVGLAAFFTASGIGVKEGILFLVLAAVLPTAVVIVASLVFRLMYVVVELVLAGVAVWLDRTKASSKS
ncbi:flippase-like domain-containing protein [bacterium]|nr:flippase-like domain-containing protein [bacterium]